MISIWKKTFGLNERGLIQKQIWTAFVSLVKKS